MGDKKKKGFIKRIALFGGAGLFGLLALTFVGLYIGSSSALGETYEVETYAIEIPEGDDEAIARGKYLVNHVMGCNHSECHRADFGGGAVMDAQPIGRVYAPNLTQGEGSVTKDYKPEDWVRILRHGIKRDNTRALIMPSEDYYLFPDEDLAAAVAYIKSQPAVNRENEGHSLGPIGMLLTMSEPVFAYDKIDHKAERPKAERGPTKEWGKVMIGACTGCHGATLSGGKIPGGDPSWPASRNLTPDKETGIGNWSFDDFKKALTTGVRPDGSQLQEMMPWKAYAGMDPDDIKALWEYLQTVPAKPAGNR
ncbi:MAG: c-type cytochrome [Planctomycetes bacterium]|nr:c-type cytochrome [Planctomycetota bacterium]MCB9934517.1 c-type cytochrome [Planctomycetota bacterium]